MTKISSIVKVLLALVWLSVSQVLASDNPSKLPTKLECDVLVVGASQSGVMASIQAARQGAKVVLVAQSDWLGGSITEAGIAAVDGNELLAFQTGLWGEFLQRLALKDPNLLSYGWVSFFTFNPKLGNELFHEWIAEEPNITLLTNKTLKKALIGQSGKYPLVQGLELVDGTVIQSKVTVDASEMGEVLELAKVPYRTGWEYAGEFKEPSAPLKKSKLVIRYPLQELTWAFFLKDYGKGNRAPKIETPSGYTLEKARARYWCAFKDPDLIKQRVSNFETDWKAKYKEAEKHSSFFSPESFITYGQASPDLFMINWPKCGNDYSLGIDRVFSADPKVKEAFYQEARTYSLWFAKYIQDTLKEKGIERFGLADEVFEARPANRNMPGFAYIPYNREVRRVEGFQTLTENDILPDLAQGERARYSVESVAIGNYANDHHYFEMAKPGSEKHFKLAPKSMKWGGRYTGTAFSIPYKVLLPVQVDGLIVAEKSWSVSHIANGSSRLQPVCMLIGQAAGAAAALAAKNNILPFNVSIKDLQATLLADNKAAPTLIPFYDLTPDSPYREAIQRLIISGVVAYPKDGNFRPNDLITETDLALWIANTQKLIKNSLPDLDSQDSKASLEVIAQSLSTASNSLTRGQIALYIEQKANTLKSLPLVESSAGSPGQALPAYKVSKYCAKLKKVGDGQSFKAEWIKDEKGQSIKRVTPFNEVVANTAGLVTWDPAVYKTWQDKLTTEPKDYCFKAAYNHSGAWLLVTAME